MIVGRVLLTGKAWLVAMDVPPLAKTEQYLVVQFDSGTGASEGLICTAHGNDCDHVRAVRQELDGIAAPDIRG